VVDGEVALVVVVVVVVVACCGGGAFCSFIIVVVVFLYINFELNDGLMVWVMCGMHHCDVGGVVVVVVVVRGSDDVRCSSFVVVAFGTTKNCQQLMLAAFLHESPRGDWRIALPLLVASTAPLSFRSLTLTLSPRPKKCVNGRLSPRSTKHTGIDAVELRRRVMQ
jgi:hypothetical protein